MEPNPTPQEASTDHQRAQHMRHSAEAAHQRAQQARKDSQNAYQRVQNAYQYFQTHQTRADELLARTDKAASPDQ